MRKVEIVNLTQQEIILKTEFTDSNDNLSVSELQVKFLVAGGESSGGYNIPGGV